MKQLHWGKCTGDVWCAFNLLNINEFFDGKYGVYVIWRNLVFPEIVYVGRGYIGERIKAHRNSEAIQSFGSSTLYVTWAEVSEGEAGGVEAYLMNCLLPKANVNRSYFTPIPVNLPW